MSAGSANNSSPGENGTLAQSWVLAAAWLIHGLLLFHLFSATVPRNVVPPGQRAAIAVAICFLLVAEIGILVLVNAAFEWLTRRIRQKRLVDAFKSVGLAVGLGLLTASVLKLETTGVHLKSSDLWFAFGNFGQILQESEPREVGALLLLPLGTIGLAVLLFFGFRKARRFERAPRALHFVVLLAVTLAGFSVVYATSRPVRLFAGTLAPEGFWLSRLAPRILAGSSTKRIPSESAAALGAPIVEYQVPYRSERPNVILVMLESIPWQRTSLAGDSAALTPNLERLAAESVVFTRPYAISTHSDYAQMSVLSSLHPRKYLQHDYYARIEYPRTLIWDALKEAGYTTSLFSCQNEQWGNMLSYLNTPGLDVLRHSLDWPEARHRGRGVESKVYEETPVSEWMHWRERGGTEPYFTYFNFQANHFPYEIPPDAPQPFVPFDLDVPVSFLKYPNEAIPVMLNRFHNALHYADSWLGKVIDFLQERGEWERTVLIVLSDHGEAFYEHGVPTHGTSLFEEQVRSFLLMRLPGVEPRRIDEPVSLLDVVPTVLEFLGLPAHGNFQGRGDILDPDYSARGRPFFFTIQGLTLEDGVLLDDLKYIVNWDRQQRALFDLASDPEERHDLLTRDSERAEELDRVLIEFLNSQMAYYGNQMWRQGRYPAILP